MTHRGPFQPLPFCDSVIPLRTALLGSDWSLMGARGEGKVCRASAGAVRSLLKASGGRKDEEINGKCRGSLFHVVFLRAYRFGLVCEGQIMSCVSFVTNIASG